MHPLKLASRGSNGSGLPAGSGSNGSSDYCPVSISLLADYPVKGWVVEGPSLAGMAQVGSGIGALVSLSMRMAPAVRRLVRFWNGVATGASCQPCAAALGQVFSGRDESVQPCKQPVSPDVLFIKRLLIPPTSSSPAAAAAADRSWARLPWPCSRPTFPTMS